MASNHLTGNKANICVGTEQNVMHGEVRSYRRKRPVRRTAV